MPILQVANVHHDSNGYARTQTVTPNTIAWFTSNSEKARIDSTGNLLVGTTTSTVGLGVKVDVAGSINVENVNATSIFTPSIELGYPSTDTTLTRSSAGVLAVEGKNVYMAGGTDVAVADGGTGQSSYTNGQLLIGNASGGLSKATITQGTGVTITNGDGSITIAATGSVVSTTGVRFLTSGTNATFTPTSGCRAFYVEVVGAGGGGGAADGNGADTAGIGGGGGGGGYSAVMITNLSQTFKYTVGAAGIGDTTQSNGGTGGSSLFYGGASGTTVLAQATGGGGGYATNSSTGSTTGSIGAPGVGSVGTFNLTASEGVSGRTVSGSPACNGLSGTSIFGGGVQVSDPAKVPNAPGAGGGGGRQNDSSGYSYGGNGGPGIIRITEFF